MKRWLLLAVVVTLIIATRSRVLAASSPPPALPDLIESRIEIQHRPTSFDCVGCVSTSTPTSTVTPTPTIAEVTLCGQLVQGVECLFLAARIVTFQAIFLLSDYGGFHVGDAVCVTGVLEPVCLSVCLQESLCFTVSKIEAAPTPTATPTPTPVPSNPCTGLPCTGACGICPQCTPGTPCPKYPCLLGTCQVVEGDCTCVSNSQTPIPTPTFGGCALACDSRPCVSRCPDGAVAQGQCANLTIDQGCACAPECATPTPPAVSSCVGDCDGDGAVTVDELLSGIAIALGNLPAEVCPAFDCNAQCGIGPLPMPPATITCLLTGVNSALDGCPPVPCKSDQDCNDGNACSIDHCTQSGCIHDCLCV